MSPQNLMRPLNACRDLSATQVTPQTLLLFLQTTVSLETL